MLQEFQRLDNLKDVDDNPTGGLVLAKGLQINWQAGPLRMADGTRNEPNGAFVETVLVAAMKRLEFYQTSKYKCVENEMAIASIAQALGWLHIRTQDREKRGVEGTAAV